MDRSSGPVRAYCRDILAPFGALTDRQWRHLTEHSVVPGRNGTYHLHYDRGIAEAFRPGRVYNVSLWTYWDAITCPVLVLRGEGSDLLPPDSNRDDPAQSEGGVNRDPRMRACPGASG